MSRIAQFLATAAAAALLTAPAATSAGQAAPSKAPAPAVAPAPKAIDARPWPREYAVDGVQFSLYRPQVDAWNGDRLEARAVMAVKTGETKDASGKMVATQDFGVLWLSARIETDKDAREAVLDNLTLPRASFPNAKDKEAKYLALARKVAPATRLVASLDQLEANLAVAQARQTPAASHPVSNDPPDIVFWNRPAMLVLVDGEPVLRPSGIAGVEQVINTRAVLLRYNGVWYIGREGAWKSARSLDGAWAVVDKPAAALTQAATKLTTAQPGGPAPVAQASGTLPDIVVRTHPTELIPSDGEPTLADLPGTRLKYVSNTPADVFVDAGGNLVRAGRGPLVRQFIHQGPLALRRGQLAAGRFRADPQRQPQERGARLHPRHARGEGVADRQRRAADGHGRPPAGAVQIQL